MTKAVLSLGSNLGDRFEHLRSAVAGLGDAVRAASPVYETAAWGGVEQDDFLNAVLVVEDSDTDAWGWLRRCQELERAAKRVRDVHWGPRTLDVDVVTVDGPDGPVLSDHPDLLLPHPGTPERATVLRPWLDVEPDAVLPGHGPVADLLAALGPHAEDGMRRRHDLVLLVPPTGSPARTSTAQLPAERTGDPAEYTRYEAGPPAHPAETWIRRSTHRTPGRGHEAR